MSRLDSAIRRLQAQRACLDWALDEISGPTAPNPKAPVLELGLGNGRTYDHLRHRLPSREIFVFERKVAAHPDCIPDQAHLLEGDFDNTLPGALAKTRTPAAMAHCDIGSGDVALTAKLAAFVGPALASLLAPGAVVAADQALIIPGATAVALPDGITPGRYYLYRLGRSS